MVSPRRTPLLPSEEVSRTVALRRKDTKTWCRGKKGRPHTPEYRINPGRQTLLDRAGRAPCTFQEGDTINWCDHEVVCTSCGKILEFSVNRQDCPLNAKEKASS